MPEHNNDSPSAEVALTPALGRFIVVLYFFSGAIGLAYQVLWARMLSLQFGVSIFGVVITAAAFMLGLGLGALHGGRWCHRIQSPLKYFAFIELVVAAYALCLPFIFRWTDEALFFLEPSSLNLWYSLYGLAALVLVVVPAWLMGVAFPLVLKAIEPSSVALSKIYGINTCGGALGALMPLWLLPTLGWATSVYLVAFIGVLIAVFAFFLSAGQPHFSLSTAPAAVKNSFSRINLLAYGLVGAAALMLEIAWTRLFGMVLLRTEYVMAVILAIFLVGIGLGSLLAKRMNAAWWINVLPVGSGLFALLSLWALPVLAAWAEQGQYTNLWSAMLSQGLALALLTLPTTLLLGAWLPLLNQRLAAHAHQSAGAILYGANAVGAAVGALVAGFVFIPWLGTTGTIVLAALLLFAGGMAWAKRQTAWAFAPLLLLAWPVSELPKIDVLLPQTQANGRDLMVHEDALAISHVVEQADGQRLLLADLQRMDASSEPAAVVAQQNQVRLALLLHPQPESVLLLGLGTGISAAAALPFPNLERSAVELSQGAINAARDWFGVVNADMTDKIKIIRDDARRYLKATDKQFDVIVGDLFHPDFVGRSALLSVQQFERAQARLNDGGLFMQWLALNQFDPHTLMVILNSFKHVFPKGVMFVDGFRLALVGTKNTSLSASAMLSNLARMTAQQSQLATGGEGAWSWLGRYWGPMPGQASGPLQDEWAPVIEYRLPKLRYGGQMDMASMMQWLLSQRVDLNQAKKALAITPNQDESFERAFIGTELSLAAWLEEFKGNSDKAQRLLHMAYQANPKDQWLSGAIADRMFAALEQRVRQGMTRSAALQAILVIRPDHVDTLRVAWQLAIVQGDAVKAAEYRQRLNAVSPLGEK